MIERYQVSGISLETGERVTGCLMAAQEGRAFITQSGMSIAIYKHKSAQLEKIIEVDPATIEPVKVKPISFVNWHTWLDEKGNHIEANIICVCGRRIEVIDEMSYCIYCGQALDWEPPAQSANRGDNNG